MINITDAEQRRRMFLQSVRRQLAFEGGLQRRLATEFKKAGDEAAESYESLRSQDGLGLVVSNHTKRLNNLLPSILLSIARAFHNDFKISLNNQGVLKHQNQLELKDFDSEWLRAMQQFLRDYTAEQIALITARTRAIIIKEIQRGVSDGLGQDEIARKIRNKTSGKIGIVRARMIARTEVHTLAIRSQRISADAVRLPYDKEWVTAGDERVRPADGGGQFNHRAMNGTRVGDKELFDMPDGDKMAEPGDPRGRAGNVINCRCVLNYHFNRG